MIATADGQQQLRVLATSDGRAFVLHCAMTDVPNAWANAGTECVLLGSTLHIAPP